MLNRHTDFDFDFFLPPPVQTPTLKLGGGAKEKTWFKFSGVLADLDRKNTHSFVLLLPTSSTRHLVEKKIRNV